jgi:RNA-directed DNA polymerase
MRQFSGLFAQIVTADNLYLAYQKARKGKKSRDEVARFTENLEQELVCLRNELRYQRWFPGKYRQFTLYERKPRLISAAPFRDRVVHHALMNIIEPLIDKTFIYDNYACRKGKGVHAAVARYQNYARRYPYLLKMDIRQYFPSIDHAILKQQLAAKINDQPARDCLYRIIDMAPVGSDSIVYFPQDDLLSPLSRKTGLPIGNLTSQFFANLYLDGFDHWIKEKQKLRGYIRYVDDLFFFADSKAELWQLKQMIEQELGNYRLLYHERKGQVRQTSEQIDVLGYQITPYHRKLRNDNGFRFFRRFRKMGQDYGAGRLNWSDINPRVQSWIGHALHADTYALRKTLFDQVTFTRGPGLR